jgi:hypothetical protein
MPLVNIFNKSHFEIIVGPYTFKPFEQITLNITTDNLHRDIRCQKGLRVGKPSIINEEYKKRHKLIDGNRFNFCYDLNNQHKGSAYCHVIESLSNPIIKNLPEKSYGYSDIPLKKINIRYFSSMRINQQGKCPVGPRDIFYSHGIADKNYWIGKRIRDYKYAFVPGPAWEKRMRNTGFEGEIFQVGYTKLDPLLNGKYEKTKRKKPYIVWAPTHGYNNKNRGRSSYPQCMQLINEIPKNYETKLALHPTSKLHNSIKHVPTLIELLDADVVIADGGSTIYEAWILGKPVILPFWLCAKSVLNEFEHDKENFEYQIYSKRIGYHAKDMKHLMQLIEKALQDGMKDEEKAFIEQIYPSKIRGKAGELAAKALLDIEKSL